MMCTWWSVINRYLMLFIWATTMVTPCLTYGEAPDIHSQKNYRIGMVLYRGETDAEKGFTQYLQQKGLKIEYTVRDAREDPTQLPEIVREMKALRPDLIYAFGTSATLALIGKAGAVNPAQHLTDIPVVFNIVADPIGSGIAADSRGSQRNVTGVTHLVPMKSQLTAMRSAGDFKTVGVIYSANENNATLSADALQSNAKAMDPAMKIRRYPVGDANNPADEKRLRETLNRIAADKPDLMYVPSDSFMIRHAALIAERLRAARIPSMSATESPIRRDGLTMGLVSTYSSAGALAGQKAFQILVNQRNAGEIPISGLDKFTFLIHMPSALAIGFYPKISALGFAEILSINGADRRHRSN